MGLEWMVWTVPDGDLFRRDRGDARRHDRLAGRSRRVRNGGDFCRSPTTPGDRLFIGLLVSAYMQLAWIGLTDCQPVDRARNLPGLDGGGHALGLSTQTTCRSVAAAFLAFAPTAAAGIRLS